MKRDFSEQQKQNLLNMVKAVQPDGLIEKINDWFGDNTLHYLNMRFGVLTLCKYLGDINVYHQLMIDKDNVSAQKIETIFTNSIGVENKYKIYLQGNLASITLYSNLLKQYYSCISVDNSSFSSQSAVGAIQQNEIYDGYRSLYIQNYQYAHKDYNTKQNEKRKYIEVFEAVYPEHKKNMNHFFDTIKDKHKTDIENIKVIVYSADEPYRSMFLDNVKYAHWGHTSPYVEDEETKNKFAFYSSEDGTINIDITTNKNSFLDDPRGQYATFFHEYGHFLDDRYCEDIDGKAVFFTENYVAQNGKTLAQNIDSDVKEIVTIRVRETFPQYTDDRVEQITKRLVEGNLPNYPDHDDDSIRQDAITVQTKIYNELISAKADGPSDAYDGSTNYYRDGSFGQNSTETGKGVSGLYQHGDTYYYNLNDKGEMVKTSRSAAKETFATYFSVKIRGDAESFELYKKYLSSTTDSLDDAVKEMIKERI